MNDLQVRIWFDSDSDYLEVAFDQRPGPFRETASGHVMRKVDPVGAKAM